MRRADAIITLAFLYLNVRVPYTCYLQVFICFVRLVEYKLRQTWDWVGRM